MFKLSAASRQRLVDWIARRLRLTCSSTFQPPGTKVPYRCVGRPGHAGRWHGGAGAGWPVSQDSGEHPGEPIMLRTSEMGDLIGKLTAEREVMVHLLLVYAKTAGLSAELAELLDSDTPDLARCRALAAGWVDTTGHLMTCLGAASHTERDEASAAAL